MLNQNETMLLDRLLPSSEVLGAGSAIELGRALGRGLFKGTYGETNRELLAMAKRLRSWLVSPPGGEYLSQLDVGKT